MAYTRVNAKADEVLRRTPGMGRIMVAGNGSGVTHECIAAIASVADEKPGRVRLLRASGSSLIDASLVASVLVNRDNKMRDKYYPTLGFRGADGATLFSITGFDGLEPFDDALKGLDEEFADTPGEAPVPEAPATRMEGRRMDDALALAQKAACDVEIGFEAGGLLQSWTGRIGELRPAMGFLNILQPDFHLHVKDGSIGYWIDVPAGHGAAAAGAGRYTLAACTPEGVATPLFMRLPVSLVDAVRAQA